MRAALGAHPHPLACPAVTGLRGAWLAALVLLPLGCKGQSRDPEPRPNTPGAALEVPIQLGETRPVPATLSPYADDAAAVADGERLFSWFNCAGCHSAGGGGAIGPPLFDDEWIYGGDPRSVYQSIVEGRPEGMPAWGGKIPEDEIWKLVAYIRGMAIPTEEARRLRAPRRLEAWVERRQ